MTKQSTGIDHLGIDRSKSQAQTGYHQALKLVGSRFDFIHHIVGFTIIYFYGGAISTKVNAWPDIEMSGPDKITVI